MKLKLIFFLSLCLTSLDTFSAQDNNYNSNCTICFDQITEPEVLPCEHKFCSTCILDWQNTPNALANNCPICRKEIRARQNQNAIEPDAGVYHYDNYYLSFAFIILAMSQFELFPNWS